MPLVNIHIVPKVLRLGLECRAMAGTDLLTPSELSVTTVLAEMVDRMAVRASLNLSRRRCAGCSPGSLVACTAVGAEAIFGS